MKIMKYKEGSKLTLALDGRLDTVDAQHLEKELRTSIDGVTELIFDLGNLSYVASAGLRVLSIAQKVMNRQGHLKIVNTQPNVKEIFEMAGFTDIMEIE